MTKIKNVLFTDGSGYIGNSLVQLIKNENANILITSRNSDLGLNLF